MPAVEGTYPSIRSSIPSLLSLLGWIYNGYSVGALSSVLAQDTVGLLFQLAMAYSAREFPKRNQIPTEAQVKILKALYKELGIPYRHPSSQTSANNRINKLLKRTGKT